MQKFKIALYPPFATATTQSTNSQLVLSNNTLVYNLSGFGGEITNSFNVVQYLNNPNNSQIAMSFLSFLTGNTTQSQLQEIIHNNDSLSNTFNDYYNSYIVKNITPTTNVISQEIYNTSAITYVNNTVFVDQNNRAKNTLTTNFSYDTGNTSYYINVIIPLSENLLYDTDFGQYTSTSFGNTGYTTEISVFDFVSGNTEYSYVISSTTLSKKILLQSFVDYNFDDNESEYWTN